MTPPSSAAPPTDPFDPAASARLRPGRPPPNGRKHLRIASILAALLGLTVLAWLLTRIDVREIGKLLERAGFGLLWLVPFHAVPMLFEAQSWRILLAHRTRAREIALLPLLWIVSVREAVNRLLPVAFVGGEIVGVRLAMLRGIHGAVATASIIIETLLTFLTQCMMTVLGVALMVGWMGQAQFASRILLGVLILVPVPVVVALLLRYGSIFKRLEAVFERMFHGREDDAALFDGARVDAEISAQQAQPARLLLTMSLQLSGYLVGAFENWVALRLLGHPCSWILAIVVEATFQGIRHFMFFVPAGIGVQEAGVSLFGTLFGLDGETSVALSVAKRMREILYGVPALLSWQWAESRRLNRAA